MILMVTMMMTMMMLACRHIPTMTKSHHGGNMSVMIKVGMCHCQNPTIHEKVQLNILVIIYSMFPTLPQHMAQARFVQFRSITPSILNMPFHVCHQLACPNGCIATLVAFIWLFAAMSFQMHPQIACLRGCKVTLVAFV